MNFQRLEKAFPQTRLCWLMILRMSNFADKLNSLSGIMSSMRAGTRRPLSPSSETDGAVVVKRARHSKDDPITEAESKAPECIPMDETTSEAAASGDGSGSTSSSTPAYQFVTLNDVIWRPRAAGSILLKRDCYTPLLKAMIETFEHWDVLLLGSGGIGKTEFQFLLCNELLDQGKTVVVDLEHNEFWCLRRGEMPRRGVRGHNTLGFPAELALSSTVYLYDMRSCPNDDACTTLSPLDVEARSVVSIRSHKGSDRLHGWRYKRNGRLAQPLYMPPWSLEELLALRAFDPRYRNVPPALVEHLFSLYGGCVRYTLVNLLRSGDSGKAPHKLVIERLQSLIMETVHECSGSTMVKCMWSTANLVEVEGLFHQIPTADFQAASYQFCSEYARDQLIKSLGPLDLLKIEEMLVSNNAIGPCTAIREAAYQAYIYRNCDRLLSGRSLNARQFHPDGFVTMETITLPLCKARSIFTNVSEIAPEMYSIPRTAVNNPFDAICRPHWAFRVAISRRTDLAVSLESVRRVKAELGLDRGQPLYIVTICTPDVAANAKWQPLLDSHNRRCAAGDSTPDDAIIQYCIVVKWVPTCEVPKSMSQRS